LYLIFNFLNLNNFFLKNLLTMPPKMPPQTLSMSLPFRFRYGVLGPEDLEVAEHLVGDTGIRCLNYF